LQEKERALLKFLVVYDLINLFYIFIDTRDEIDGITDIGFHLQDYLIYLKLGATLYDGTDYIQVETVVIVISYKKNAKV
jgi:hypothetical protein